MISVGLSEDAANYYLLRLAQSFGTADVVVGCINSPTSVTLTGDLTQINAVESWLQEDSVFIRRLPVNVAYHSPHMNVVANEYLMQIKDLEAGKPTRIAMISSVTGAVIQSQELCHGDYWIRNMVSPVHFSKALAHICTQPAKKQKKRLGQPVKYSIATSDLLEVGPHSALRAPIRDILTTIDRIHQISYHTCLVRHTSAASTFMEAMGRLYCSGYHVDLLVANKMATKSSQSRPVLTDLPEYPFNHSQSYWLESRVSKGLRFRKHAKLDLLGVPSPDWNSLEPQWRNVIRSNEIPWIEDHKVNSCSSFPMTPCTNANEINGVCIYPAAGMISMAVEAARQMADEEGTKRRITGYSIGNAQFSKTLNIPLHPSHVETLFYLRPLKEGLENEATWSEYRLCVYEDRNWEECCRGRIQVEYELSDNLVDGGKEATQEALYHEKIVNDGFKACDIPMATEQLYKMMSDHGAQYGPAFQVLSNLYCSSSLRESAAEVNLGQWTVRGDKNFAQPYVFHRTTLDGLFQTIVPALSEGGHRKVPTMVPSRIGRLWISAFGLADPDRPPIRAFSRCQFKGYREAQSSISAVSSETSRPCFILEDLESTFVTNDRPTRRTTKNDIFAPASSGNLTSICCPATRYCNTVKSQDLKQHPRTGSTETYDW